MKPLHHEYHVLAKPVGPICNLDCQYCFYLEKERLYPGEKDWRMSDTVLEAFIRQYIAGQDSAEINFAWQGGEPTLLGVDFYRKVIELQRLHADGKMVFNAIQTNGTLLDDEWCAFLAEQSFLVGLSVDGPEALHDRYRIDKRGQPTFAKVMRGLEMLKKHGVQFNTLTVVNQANGAEPLAVYRFLKEIGSEYLQFIPLVERAAPAGMKSAGYDFAAPDVQGADAEAEVAEWSVGAEQYGDFLCEIFDEWVENDVGKTYVQLFDIALGNWMGLGSALCVFAEKCGRAMAIEHNGDIYSCDHYVYPEYRLGNLMNTSLGEMAGSARQAKFGSDKLDTLPRYCRECEVRFACNGECPKHRFIRTPDGEAGLNYLCAGYRKFFNYVDPYMRMMAALLRQGEPAARIMELVRLADGCRRGLPPGRNVAKSFGR